MMYKAFLVKYAEIGIKGKNRHLFEKALCVQMEHALAPVDGNFQVTREMGRIYVNTEGDFDYEGAVDALTRVFGIAEICPVVILEDTGFEDLAEAVVSYVKELYPTEEKTFKVCARRANKNYPMHTMEVNCELGGRILDVCPNLKVDVHEPDIYLNVELRQKIYLYCESIAGPGGMPVGTNGHSMLRRTPAREPNRRLWILQNSLHATAARSVCMWSTSPRSSLQSTKNARTTS